MIKQLMILGVSLVCFTACSKDNGLVNNEAKKVEVKFNVQALNVDVQPMNVSKSIGTRAEANSVLTDIQYYFFNTETNEKVSGSQSSLSTDGVFGQISVLLSPGHYDAIFLGNTANNAGGTFSVNLGDNITSGSAFSVFDKEVFYLKTTYDITSATKSEEVDLSRVVGKLVLQLNDKSIPSDVSRIGVSFDYLPRFRPMYNESTTTTIGYHETFNKDLVFTSSQIDELGVFLLPQQSKTMTITTYDSKNNPLGSTHVVFSIYSNKRTVVQGNLFDVLNGRGFTITVTDTWDADVIIPL